MIADAELLRRYVESRSEAAFAAFVERHLNLVYFAALRRVNGNAALAEDVAQYVFTTVAREAASLMRHATLTGWLYTTTRNAAAKTVRAEQSRRRREQEAEFMHDHAPEPAIDAERLRPVIDETLEALNPREREAVLLRFFEGRAFGEIGAALKISEDAARMRVERALEKLRTLLARRGVTSTSAALGMALTQQAALAAPTGLTLSVTSSALAGGTASGVAGALTIFTMTKLELGTLALLLAAGTAAFTWERMQTQAGAAEVAALRNEHSQLVALQTENRRLAALAAANARPAAPPRARVASNTGSPAALDEATAGLLAAGMKPMSAWRNLGRATPAEALETTLWAVVTGDLDVLATMIAFFPAGKAKLDAWFLTLPSAVRAKYGTAERVIAPVLAANFPGLERMRIGGDVSLQLSLQNSRHPVGYKLVGVGEPDRGGHAPLQVLFSTSHDADRPERIYMWSSPDGWRNARFLESMVDRFVARIDPATGEPRAVAVSVSP